jgi:hypothetical protein
MFCTAISFTYVLGKLFVTFQNHHDQTVLTRLVSGLYTYPEPSNSCLKAQKKHPKGSVVEPEPHGAETFGWSRKIKVSAPAPGQLKYFEKI